MIFLKCILHLNLIHLCFGYKILMMFPFPFKSHEVLGRGILRHLVDAGHEVTYISTFSVKKSFPSVRNIVLSTGGHLENKWNLNACLNKDRNATDVNFYSPGMIKYAEYTLTDEAFKEFINDTTNKFDVAIIEWMYNEVYSGLSAVFQCPYIWFFSFEQDLALLSLIHEFPNLSYSTNLRTLNIPPLNLIHRLQELWYQATYMYTKQFNLYKKEVETYEKIFVPIMKSRGKPLPAYNEIRLNASLAFSNTHISIRDINITPENYKAIGGYHIDDHNIEPLDKDLQDIMDKSTNGVIIFSMGSTLDFKDMPNDLMFDIIKMLGNLNQTVLWKSNMIVETLPHNVKILSWLPQQRILAHKNCVLIVTHGGVSSFIESVHFGVPIVGIPSFADQFMNVKMAVKNGYGRKVDLSLDMVDDLEKAIKEVLNNPEYKIMAKKRSLIYHDRLVPPGKEMVYWLEHVVKTQGALHLRSPALLVSWYQRYYLDLFMILIFIIYIVIVVMRKLNLSKIMKTKKIKKN